MKNRILYEDEHLIAVNKSAGELVVVDRWKKEPKENIIINWLGDYLRSMGHAVDSSGRDLYPVHRLDRETSGIVLFAKNENSHRLLSGLFEKRKMEKTYWAFTIGIPEWDSCEIRLPLRRQEGKSGRGRAIIHIQGGSDATTTFKVLEKSSDLAWVEAKPTTGRLHQIRLHLRALGYPILNDKQYGITNWKSESIDLSKITRMSLHARTLEFLHPITEAKISLEAPLDNELRELVSELKMKRRSAR